MLNLKSNIVPYEGKRIVYNNDTYILIPEKLKDSCYRCCFYNTHCPSEITNYCLRGFIYRREDGSK